MLNGVVLKPHRAWRPKIIIHVSLRLYHEHLKYMTPRGLTFMQKILKLIVTILSLVDDIV